MGILDGAAVLGSALNGVSLGKVRGGAVNNFIAEKLGGNLVAKAGLHYAAAGGQVTKGVLIWQGWDASTRTRRWVPFTFPFNPDELTESYAPEYAAIKVPGQNHAQYQFVHGGEKSLGFKLHFFYSPAKVGFVTGQLDVLKQLVHRGGQLGDTAAASAAPPAVFLYFGRHIQGDRFITTKLDIKCLDLFDPAFLLPMRAEVDIELKRAPAPDVRPDSRVLAGVQHGTLSAILKAGL